MPHGSQFAKLPAVFLSIRRLNRISQIQSLQRFALSTLCISSLCLFASGCISTSVWQWGDDGPPREEQLARLTREMPKLENPLSVPLRDRDFLWEILVDTIEDYFPLQNEERIQLVGNTLTEGYLQTAPTDAATMFEPWRKDNVSGFDQLHATLQSIQRQAEIYVRPSNDGFRIEVIVHKLLEELAFPEYSTIGGATLRHSSSHSRPQHTYAQKHDRLGWIPQGRDTALEQAILQDLQQRMNEATIPASGPPSSDSNTSTLGPLRIPDLGLGN